MKNKANLTDKEIEFLKAIADSEYCNLEYTDERLINYGVWMFSVSDNYRNKKTFSGLTSSLKEKGYINTDTNGDPRAMGVSIKDTWTIWITASGFEELNKAIKSDDKA